MDAWSSRARWRVFHRGAPLVQPLLLPLATMISAARRGVALLWAVFTLCSLSALGVMSAVAPEFAAAVTLAGLAAYLVVRRPYRALIFLLLGEALGLVFVLVGIDGAIVSIGTFGLLLLAACASAWTAESSARVVAGLAVLTGLVGAYGIVLTIGTLPPLQIAAATRLLLLPLLCFVVGTAMTRGQAARLVFAAMVCLSVSLAASLYQRHVGVEAMLSFGLEWGTHVRTYAGDLRAPGTFETNYAFGAFSGVVGAVAVSAPGLAGRWRWVIVALSAVALYVTVYRTGVLILLVAIVLRFYMYRPGMSLPRRMAMVAVAGGGLSAWFMSGYASLDSVLDRLQLWKSLIANNESPWLGGGLGSAGSASQSRFSVSPVVVDNNYLTLYLQIGLLGALLAAALISVTFFRVQRFRRLTAQDRVWDVVFACCVGAVFVDLFEYTAVVLLAAGLAGATLRKESSATRQAVVGESPRRRPLSVQDAN